MRKFLSIPGVRRLDPLLVPEDPAIERFAQVREGRSTKWTSHRSSGAPDAVPRCWEYHCAYHFKVCRDFWMRHRLLPTPPFRDSAPTDPIQEIALRVVVELPDWELHVIGTATLIGGRLSGGYREARSRGCNHEFRSKAGTQKNRC